MIRALALFAILCGLLLIFGGSAKPDRMSVSTLNEKRLLTVVITLHSVTENYRWLSVYGCSAEMGESGTYCTGYFERESSFELAGRKQYLVFWRDLPGGTMLIHAMAFDVDRKVLARGQTVVFR